MFAYYIIFVYIIQMFDKFALILSLPIAIGISLVPRRFGLFTSLSARGTAREAEKWKIRREAPGRIRIQNGGSVFCKYSVLFILLLK